MFRDVHVLLGYTMLGLIGFRLVWGLVGTRYARFSSFLFGPSKVVAYLKSLLTGSPQHYVGHNPAGSWAIYGLLLLGYTMLGLIGFRLVWGLIGTRYARFSSFLFGPSKVVAYLKSLLTGSPQHYVGHNPAGSWAIYGLLLLGLLSGATGYAVYNQTGGEWLEELHEAAANTMLALVVVHVAGVLVSSLLHRENLVRAMIYGYKKGEASQGVRRAHWLIGAGLLTGAVALWSVIR